MKDAPAIITRRLFMRPVELGDAAQTAALMTPGVSAMLTSWPSPMTTADATVRIADSRQEAADGMWLDWAIFLKRDLILVGWVGLGLAKSDDRRLRLGYWIAESFHNRRYGSEAVAAAINESLEQYEVDAVEALVLPGNEASIKLLMRLGFEAHANRERCFVPSRMRYEEFVRFERSHGAIPATLDTRVQIKAL